MVDTQLTSQNLWRRQFGVTKKVISRWCQVSPGDDPCKPVTTSPSVVSHQGQHLIVVVVSYSFRRFYDEERLVGSRQPTDHRVKKVKLKDPRAKNSRVRRKASSSVNSVVEDGLRPGTLSQLSAGRWTVESDGRIFATEEFGAAEEELWKWYGTFRPNAHVTMTTDFRQKTIVKVF